MKPKNRKKFQITISAKMSIDKQKLKW